MKKNTQLRRLNKVLHNGEIKTIDLISPGYVAFIEDRNDQSIFGEWVDLDDISFVELSEEILLKCGFIYKDECYYYENTKIILDAKFTLLDIDIYVNIEYLHKLQNLIYLLTNKELEFKQ